MNQLNGITLHGELRLGDGGTVACDGRLHITGNEILFILNRNGAIVSKAWGGSGDLVVDGRVGVNGQPATPRTPGWGGGIRTWDIEVEGTGWSRSGWQTGRRDLAENHYCEEPLETGSVVSFGDRPLSVTLSRHAEDQRVMGVVSSAPGMLLGVDPGSDDHMHVCAVALAGRVPCNVTDENGPIEPGDLLTCASTPGHAMKAKTVTVNDTPLFRTGTILGKALESSRAPSRSVQVLLCLS
jgi:hypothetical protein